MAKAFLNLTGLTTFLAQLTSFFAATSEVAQVESDTDTYVLSIDYESLLSFDTTEIIIGEDDITLADNEALLSTASDEILIGANYEYIIVEGGE